MILLRWLLIVVMFLLVSRVSEARDVRRAEEARTHLRVGLELYAQGKFDEAIAEFRAGQAADPQPDFLYALGQSERRRGNCRAALVHYRAFVKEAHELEQVGAATKVMATCEKEVAIEDARVAEQARLAEQARIAEQARLDAAIVKPPPPRPRPWYRDPLGDALMGVGGASLVAGVGLFGFGQYRYAHALANYDDYIAARNATPEFRAGLALLAVGGVAVVGGAIRWGRLAHRSAR